MTRTSDRTDEVAATGRSPQIDGTGPGNDRRAGATTGVELTLGELAGLAVVTTLAAVAVWSLALAQLGRHDGWLALGLGVATTGVVAAVALALDGRPRVRFDPVELAILGALTVAGLFMFLPGFNYVWDDKDPGVYVAHGYAIARDGDVWIDDDVVARGVSPATDQAGRFPGVWFQADRPNQVTSQFYHQYSALLATAHDLAGSGGLLNVNPVVAVVSVGLTVLAVRRAASTLVAVLTGALLVTSMMQVWQARYPSTEIPAQAMLAGALLAAVLAIERRSAGAGLVAGLLAGAGFLARPDGFLYIVLAAAAVALALATDRFDRRSWAVLGGLAATVPYAFWNAYVAREPYSVSNDVPGAAVVGGAVVALLAAGWAARYPIRAVARRWPGFDLARPDELPRRLRLAIGLSVGLAAATVLVLLFFRQEIFGLDYDYLVFSGRVERSFDELNMKWLSYFVTVRGLVLMGAGIFVLMLSRWRAALFALVVPGALLLPLYLYDAKVSMRLMWWVRRFIPAVVPVIMILIALALCWLLTRRHVLVKVVGGVLALMLVVEFARMSLPLRDHDEMAGSAEIAAEIADFAGDEQALFLFPPGHDIYSINRNAPGIVWLVHDQIAARLPRDPGVDDVEPYRAAFADMPIFFVERRETAPSWLADAGFVEVGQVEGSITILEEIKDGRPQEVDEIAMAVTVWRLDGTPAA
ncbi:MAG TPA: glycosyltransferase family 39 protein [Acidimicrobiales bacterium]|nr:glycosyltransferase family 39 protein [Acidimicrobiales bacterium]